MHRLALALGKTVHEIESQMTMREFYAWLDFYAVEPFGDTRADIRAGIIAATTANVYRGKGKKPFSPSDFMLFKDESEADPGRTIASKFAEEFGKATKNLPINIVRAKKKPARAKK
jgi:hypothetical protein